MLTTVLRAVLVAALVLAGLPGHAPSGWAGTPALTAATADLARGYTGPAVAALQRRLRAHGYDPGETDGRFGPVTEAALRRAQADFALPATGVADGAILQRLQDPRRHLVRRGENLWLIAREYGTTAAAIAAVNGLRQPDLVLSGQELNLPEPDATAAPASSDSGTPAPEPPGLPASAVAAAALAAADLPLRLYEVKAPAEAQRPAAAPLRLVPATVRPLALTFNDGPDPVLTPLVLDILDRYQMKGTFFVHGGAAAAFPEVVRLMISRGHEVGSHGYAHGDLTRLTPRAAEAELVRTRTAIRAAAGTEPRFFRPPLGRYTRDLQAVAERTGHRLVMWTNIGARDTPAMPPEFLAAQVAEAAFPGAVIMLHDTRRGTVAALPEILSRLQAAGFRSLTLSGLVGTSRQLVTQ